MYGENPFLIDNNKLFFNFCQSPILFFKIPPLAFLIQRGMITKGRLSMEEIAEYTDLPMEEVRELARLQLA
ncbi:MAG: hypothetical protein HFI76_11095 [Lachnospiraceae bacterium]|jgi:hypothetical protein|nr:hypothetical protein [Lachnospiraceae bacterium]